MGSAPIVDWAILKIAQRCNINCDYCYVYNRGDDGWRARPAVMLESVVEAFTARVFRHSNTFSLKEFHVEFHGGEPLLVGRKRFESICETIRTGAGVPIRFHMQTNGILLDRDWLELLDRFDVSFGISLDGPPGLHDRHRVDHKGRGTAYRLLRTLHDLSSDVRFHRLFGGALCVVSEPLPHGGDLLDWFVSNGVLDLDFLLPDGNHVNPPTPGFTPEPYTQFWLQVYDRWSSYGDQAPRIRTLRTFLRGLVGERSTIDAHGGDLRTMLVVETDGSIGISDVGRICEPLNADIHSVMVDELCAHQERADLATLQTPAQVCTRCQWFSVCGGGYLPHRFNGKDFASPSIYCGVWDGLLTRMNDDMQGELDRIRYDARLPPACATAGA